MKTIIKDCKDNGLVFRKKGRSKYQILTTINKKSYAWACASIKDCKEAIFQAGCLKKWIPETT